MIIPSVWAMRKRPSQDVEKVLQLRSRVAQRLNVRDKVRFASPLAPALLEDLFEHPVDHSHSGYDVHAIESDRVSEWLFNSLLDPFQ